MLEQPAQRGCECSISGGVQDQVGWGPEQPGLVPDLEVGGPASLLTKKKKRVCTQGACQHQILEAGN